MAELNAKRYQLIMEALEFRVRNKNTPHIDSYKGWKYEGREGIFWTARKNFPQYYTNKFKSSVPEVFQKAFENEHESILNPTPLTAKYNEADMAFAEEVLRAHYLKLDPVFEKYFEEDESPDLDAKTAGRIDEAIKYAPPIAAQATTAAPGSLHGPSRTILPAHPSSVATLEKELLPTVSEAEPITPETPTQTAGNQPGQSPLPEYIGRNFGEEPPPPVFQPPAPTKIPDKFIDAFENEPKDKLYPEVEPANASEIPNQQQAPAEKVPPPSHLQTTPPAISTSRRLNLSFFKSLKVPNPVKSFGSGAGIFLKRNLGGGLSSILGGVARGSGTPGSGGLLNSRFPSRISNIKASAESLLNRVGSKKWLWLILLLAPLLIILGGGAALPIGGSGSIATCTFTRSGVPNSIKSTILQGWIVSAANTAGIPPAILASVAMHESQSFVVNADNNHDDIKSNNYCNYGKKFCEKNGQVLHSREGQDDPCTQEEITDGARTAQAVGLMQVLDIYNQGKGDLCSITNSLAIAAAKLKNDGVTLQPTQEQINTAIRKYYGSCTYGSYSYCNEVWTDHQNCKQTTPPPSGVASSCPIENGRISTGSYSSIGTGSKHCNIASGYPTACDPNSRRAKSIDILTGEKTPMLPTINGQIMKWNYIADYDDATGGWAHVFRATDSSGINWDLQFLHLQRNALITKTGGPYDSGTLVAQSATGFRHVHVTIGKNIVKPTNNCLHSTDPNICNLTDPGWLNADTDMHMCPRTTATTSTITPVTVGKDSKVEVAIVTDRNYLQAIQNFITDPLLR